METFARLALSYAQAEFNHTAEAYQIAVIIKRIVNIGPTKFQKSLILFIR
jgi:hypothetical protein